MPAVSLFRRRTGPQTSVLSLGPTSSCHDAHGGRRYAFRSRSRLGRRKKGGDMIANWMAKKFHASGPGRSLAEAAALSRRYMKG